MNYAKEADSFRPGADLYELIPQEQAMKIGVLTGGGDCPGLNAVIRAIVRKGSDKLEEKTEKAR